MKKVTFLLVIGLYFALAGILYAATTNTEGPLPDEDVLLCRVVFLHSLTSIDIYKGRADIIYNGKFYTLDGVGGFDKYGAVDFLESPTGNAVTILPDGSCDLFLNGVQYRFQPE